MIVYKVTWTTRSRNSSLWMCGRSSGMLRSSWFSSLRTCSGSSLRRTWISARRSMCSSSSWTLATPTCWCWEWWIPCRRSRVSTSRISINFGALRRKSRPVLIILYIESWFRRRCCRCKMNPVWNLLCCFVQVSWYRMSRIDELYPGSGSFLWNKISRHAGSPLLWVWWVRNINPRMWGIASYKPRVRMIV